MNLRGIVLSAILLAAWPLTAREKTDVLVMKNGDRLTCEIKSLSADVLYISLDYALGTVSINWFEVDHLESNNYLSSKPRTEKSILALFPCQRGMALGRLRSR